MKYMIHKYMAKQKEKDDRALVRIKEKVIKMHEN